MALPKRASYYKYIGSTDLSIMTKVTRATRATRAANSFSISIKLGFSFLLSLIGTSTFLKYSD